MIGSDYTSFARDFDKTRVALWKNVCDLFDSNVCRYDILYDIGCGNGKYANYRNDITYIGCDICEGLLECASRWKRDLVCASGLRLPYIDESCDVSISIAVLHHLDSIALRRAFIQELVRVTRRSVHFTVWAAEQPIKKKWIRIKEDENDYLIPWQNIYQRYYHLFSKSDLEELLSVFGFRYEMKYECGNWCVTLFL